MGFIVVGAKTLLFLAQLLLAIAVVGLFIVAFVWVISQTIQVAGNLVGYEVGSLWEWFASKLPKRSKRSKTAGKWK